MSKEKKFMCIGGYVYSDDGDRHFISPHELPILYGVERELCVFIAHNANMDEFRGWDLIKLRPDSSGRYELPCKPV